MRVAVVSTPYTFASEKRGAASLHIGYIISILKNECGVDVRYFDYNTSPFHLYSQVIEKMAKTKVQLPIRLLYTEKLHLLNRLALEEIYGVPESMRTNSLFGINAGLAEKLSHILTLAFGSIVTEIFAEECDAILVFVSPDITYALALCNLIHTENPKVPVILCDNYTFEPATPYFAAPLTRKDIYGNSVEKVIGFDPLTPVMEKMVPEMLDWIIIGEGYDVIRTIFNSRYGTSNLEGVTYTAPSKGQSEPVFPVSALTAKNGVTIVHSCQIDLDTLPLHEFAEMREIYDAAEFEITRGCPYNCMFCERTGMFGNLIRSHSLEYMERLIKHTLSYGFKYYTNIDTALNIDEAKSIEFLQMLKRNKIKFPYQANLRGRRPNRELVRLIAETGCKEIAIGIETGDEHLLKSMNKVQDLSILYELVSSIAENQMELMLFLIVGFPTESLESIGRTLQFMTNIHSFAKIDVVNMELYHAGHIQALGPHKYEKYGIEWTKPQDLKEIESASRLFLEPGLYGQAKYKYGMDRFQTHTALEMYTSRFKDLGIENFVCHNVTQKLVDK